MTNLIGDVVVLEEAVGVSDDDNVASLQDFRDSKDLGVGERKFLYRQDALDYEAICRRRVELNASIDIGYRPHLYVRE
jgi:hypothetical protein